MSKQPPTSMYQVMVLLSRYKSFQVLKVSPNKEIMKYAHVYALFLVFVFHSSCGQNQTNPPEDNIKDNR